MADHIVRTLVVSAAMLLFLVWGAVAQSGNPRADLMRTVVNMGYDDVSLNNCSLSYSRNVTPTEQNNHFRHYRMHLLLDTLLVSEDLRVRKREYPNYSFYELSIPLSEKYRSKLIEITRIKIRLIKQVPGSSWPQGFPGSEKERVPIIQSYLSEYSDILSGMNRVVEETVYGTYVRPLENISISYSDTASLEKFRDDLNRYSNFFGCN
jgi:hypothetical protein